MSDTATTTNKGGRPKLARGAATSSAEAGPAWSIRGVAPNVRAIALRAAVAQGATVGDWVSEAIVRYSRGGRGDGAETPESPSDGQQVATIPPATPEVVDLYVNSLPALEERLLEAIERGPRRSWRRTRRGR